MSEQTEKTKNETIHSTAPRSFTEELQVAGNQLLERLQEVVKQGNVRRVIIKDTSNGRTLLEVPLTLGVAGAGAVIFIAPFLAVIGVIAGLVAKVSIIIERYENPADAAKEKIDSVIEHHE